ncbi:MAG: PAS domain-containing protein [Candidatus Nanopelagicales bacterium]|jgi:PAS domain S-box-containing protein
MDPQTVLDSLDIAVYSKDREGRYTYANRMVCDLFGAPLADIVGKDDTAFFDLEASSELRENDREVMDSGASVTRTERDVIKETGEERMYLTVKAPIRDASGAVVGLAGVSIDITEG